MDPMRWLRKHNKKILTFLVVFIAVMFTVPNIISRGRSSGQKSKVIGHYELNGKTEEFTTIQHLQANGELEVLDTFGLGRVLELMAQNPGLSRPLALMELGVSPQTLNMLERLLSSQRGISEDERDEFLDAFKTSGVEDNSLAADLDGFVTMSKNEAGRYYWLLKQEARQGGFAATPGQLENVFSAHRELQARGYMQSVEDVCRHKEITEAALQGMVGNYLMVLRYAEAMTGGPEISERQLRRLIRDDVESNTVLGTYVTFSADLFFKEEAEPGDGEIAEHFQKYKANFPGRVQKDNPFGFGYKLPDRARLEYICVNVKQLNNYYKEQFEAQTPVQQEETVRKYWEENKKQFSRRLPPDQNAPENQPQFYDPPFDEVADHAQEMMLQLRAKEKADAMLNTAKQMSQTASGIMAETLTDEQRREKASDYNSVATSLAAQAEQELGRKIDIVAATTDYMSADDIDKGKQFRGVMQYRRNQMQTLSQLVFRSQPFRPKGTERSVSSLGLYEDATDLYKSSGEGVTEGYMMRIIGADLARVASSPMDDGSQGPAAEAGESAESKLRQRIVDDIKRLRAFESAQEHAGNFAQAAKGNWDEALKQANGSLSEDPNKPGPLREQTLEQIHQHIEQYRQIQNQYFQERIRQYRMFLQQVVEIAYQEKQDESAAPLLVEETRFACHVFKDLQTTPPTQEEYLRRKPMTAISMSMAEPRLLLAHFSPPNIDRRMKYSPEEPLEQQSAPMPMPEPSPMDDTGEGPI
ncbi:MAG: hypothetical protein JW709_13745 [Sedimentisphaerales bacterium]|nr:hypothetical protein [Sedimentisphaerales bacterium]